MCNKKEGRNKIFGIMALFLITVIVFVGGFAYYTWIGKRGETEKLQTIEDKGESTPITLDKTDEEEIISDIKVDEVSQKGILIAIDPGHQSAAIDMSASEENAPGSGVQKQKATGGTTGKFTGVPEYQLNLTIALILRDKLEQKGYQVLMTRENNETAISNKERAVMANEAGASMSIRIHANGSENPESEGALCLIPSSGNPYAGQLHEESRRLAESILIPYCAETGFSNQGIIENDTMTGINWSTIPVVILEMGFMTNEFNDVNMQDAAMQDKMALAIVRGIDAYYGE